MMRWARATLLLTLVAFAWPGEASAFDPRGRKRKGQSPQPKSTQRVRSKGQAPSKARVPAKRAPESTASEPSQQALIQRYTGIVLSQPGAAFPLQRLSQLVRERDGNLDQLIADFERRAGGGKGQYNAIVALAGLQREAGQDAQAEATYRRAISIEPKNPVALMALARLLRASRQRAEAREAFAQALTQLKVGAEIEQTLRELLALSLELDDVEAARHYHSELVKRAKGSFFVRAELGRELLTRGKYAAAVEEYRRLVKAVSGDNRALAPALRDLGLALSRQGQHEEALSTLQRALKLTAADSGVHREILDNMVEVYRASERLPELVTLLEKQAAHDFHRTRLLAGLYEETGRIDEATATYRKAQRLQPRDVEVRLKLVQLLQIQGQLDQVAQEYRELIKAAPHNPEFVFQLADALLQRGDRTQALRQLSELERRASGDEQTLAGLVDFYERIGDSERSRALLERLARTHHGDPQHLIELGNRYYQAGNTELAQRTWQRLLVQVPNRARALHLLGETYLEHDMSKLALKALSEAAKLAPDQRRYKKSLALAYERTAAGASKEKKRDRYAAAQKLWEELLQASGDSPHLQRESRQHIVTLWSLGGSLRGRVGPLERDLARTPPDLESGRLLGEVYLRMRRYADAERTLQTVVEQAPGDVGSALQLERVLVLQRKLKEAVAVLSKLTQAEPKRAREFYQRMAQYSAELYQDEEAIRYATRAVELSPDDATGHQRLAEMQRQRQHIQRAISEYRKAIEKNPRLFAAYFELAELLIGQQQTKEADGLLRRVMRSAVDEELVSRATRLSMQLNLSAGSLEGLEHELLPLALGNPERPVYRRLLVEIYGALAFPLVQKSRSEDPEVAREANQALRRIGQRAVKPLLDALRDVRGSQQHVAIELLTHLQSPSATAALYTYATSDADPQLRMRAMIAAGAAADPAMLPRYEELLLVDGQPRVDEGDPVQLAAVWGLSRLTSRKAQELKLLVLESDSVTAQTLAAVSLGLSRVERAKPKLTALLRDSDRGGPVRAAAAHALSELGVKSEKKILLQLAESSDDELRASALVSLARLAEPSVKPQLAGALVGGSMELQRAARGAAAVLVKGHYRPRGDPFRVPDGRIAVRKVLRQLSPAVSMERAAEVDADILATLGPELAEACAAAVRVSPELARSVADALLARGGRPAFGALTAKIAEASPARRQAAENAAQQIAVAVVQPFIALSQHPLLPVRGAALEFLATREEPEAQSALIRAVTDEDMAVQRVALTALAAHPRPAVLGAIVKVLAEDKHWPIRIVAAQTLAAFNGAIDESQTRAASEQLQQAATDDPYPLVREAALRSLFKLAPRTAPELLRRIAQEDEEPAVQSTALELLAR